MTFWSPVPCRGAPGPSPLVAGVARPRRRGLRHTPGRAGRGSRPTAVARHDRPALGEGADDRGAGHHERCSATTTPAATTTDPPTPTTAAPRTDVLSDPARVGQPWSTTVQGLLTVPGQPDPHLLRHGPGAGGPAGAVALPGDSGDVRCSRRRVRADAHVVRHAAGPASPPSSSGTADLGGVRRLRPQASTSSTPPPAQRHPARLPDRRHHQGLGHRRPRRLPARLHRLPRQLLPGPRHRPAGSRPSCGSCRPTTSRPTMWNDDWDGSALIIDDYLFEGGENSQFHIVKLNRGYDADGKVTVDPQLVFNAPGWDDQLLKRHRRQASLDRELGRHLGQHRLLRQLRRPGPGLGHQRPEDGASADPHVPLLDRRRHRRLGRDRQRRHALRRLRVRAPQRPVDRRSARS